MALDYTFRLCIPNTITFPLSNIIEVLQYTEWQGGYIYAANLPTANDIGELIAMIWDNVYVPNYGGTYSFNAVDLGTSTCITIRYTNLTSDPLLDGFGDLNHFGFLILNQLYHWGKVIDTATTVCDTCQQVTVQACQALYTLTTGLEPATTYTVALYGANGNSYIQNVTSDGSGNISIDTTATGFPQGAFIPESGGYIVKVYANDSLGTPLTLTVGTTQYTCINLNFTYITTTTPTP